MVTKNNSTSQRNSKPRPANAGVVAAKPATNAAIMDDPFANAHVFEVIADPAIPDDTIIATDSEYPQGALGMTTQGDVISETEMDALLRRMGWIKANETAAPPVMVAPQRPAGIEFWNPIFPNEELVLRPKGPKGLDYDPVTEATVKFMGGYFLATEDWQADAIRTHLNGRAFEADIRDDAPDIICEKCGWTTRSSRAFQLHRAQES